MKGRFFGVILLLVVALMSSCVVTKKRYDTAVANGRKSLDSLNRVFNKTVEGFNSNTGILKSNNAQKDITLDSLVTENRQLAGDKESLNQSLRNSISEFNSEREKLAKKTRTADSLMNLLTMRYAADDSLRTIDESRNHGLETLLMTVTKALSGINQSDVYAQRVGSGVIVTISNDYLFKTANGVEITQKGEQVLGKIAAVLTLNENCKVQAICNTDNVGTAKTLLELSAKRSATVISYLVANCSLPGTSYTASGRGMYNPLVVNSDDASKKKNRRTEIIILP